MERSGEDARHVGKEGLSASRLPPFHTSLPSTPKDPPRFPIPSWMDFFSFPSPSWRPIPAHPCLHCLPGSLGPCRHMRLPLTELASPSAVKRRTHLRWQAESIGNRKIPSPKRFGAKEGSGGSQRENKARRGRLQVQPGLRCMAGAPLAFRSKWSGANAPGCQNPPRRASSTGAVSHFPTPRAVAF